MKVSRPHFVEGVHWRRLPVSERPWKYKLLRDVSFHFPERITDGVHYFVDATRILRGIIEPFSITVKAGYVWNGCSCSPDWKLLPSLPHDLIYQFSGTAGFPATITRKFADDMFYAISPDFLNIFYRAGLFAGSWAAWHQSAPGCIIRKEAL